MVKRHVVQTDSQWVTKDERRWSRGSWIVLAFALFVFIYNAGSAIYSLQLPTDGWMLELTPNANPPVIKFVVPFLNTTSPIEPGDLLLAVNGQSLEHILTDQYSFYKMEIHDWLNGTVLRYEVLREGQTLFLELPISQASLWQFFWGLLKAQGSSGPVQVLGSLTFFIIGLLVFLRRPSNRAAHALLLVGVAFLFNAWPDNNTVPTLFYPFPPPSIPFDTWTAVINPSLMYLALVFPRPKWSARSFPRLTVVLLYLPWILVFNLLYLLHLDDPSGYFQAAFAVYPVQIILMMLVTLASLVHSGITVRDPVGRSQFKWMLAGIGGFVIIGVGGWLVSAYLLEGAQWSWLITVAGWFLLPICLAVAITRYHLFDIDVIIRRTLVYSALTITLGLVYFGSVILLQNLFQIVAGIHQSPIATVISTLAIVVLFSPLRRRIQNDIDQRFYRRKYNAQETLESFAARARDIMELEQLAAHLLKAVEEAMQPEKVSLWMRKKERSDGQSMFR
jgi:hypothetical protein